MKSDTDLMNELAHRTNYLHEMSANESAKIKKILVKMYEDIQGLCAKHNLKIMLGGGSCLGAVRHKGFIPWDDDLDAMMPREDYEYLIDLLRKGNLGDKYEFSAPSNCTESVTTFLKIFLKDSRYIDLFSVNTPFPKGVYIDIFAIDAAPKNSIVRFFKGIISNALEFCTILTQYAKYPSKELKEYMSLNKRMWCRYKLKCLLGKIVGIIPRKKWIWWFDQWAQHKKESPIWTIPTGRKYYHGEERLKDTFVPLSKGVFEGKEVFLPNNVDDYLHNLYGDYMVLPSKEKRERHFIHEIVLPE